MDMKRGSYRSMLEVMEMWLCKIITKTIQTKRVIVYIYMYTYKKFCRKLKKEGRNVIIRIIKSTSKPVRRLQWIYR